MHLSSPPPLHPPNATKHQFSRQTFCRYLGGNPWQCDCGLRWLPGWLEHWQGDWYHRKVVDATTTQCAGPPHRAGVPLLDLSTDALCSESDTDFNILLVLISVHRMILQPQPSWYPGLDIGQVIIVLLPLTVNPISSPVKNNTALFLSTNNIQCSKERFK